MRPCCGLSPGGKCGRAACALCHRPVPQRTIERIDELTRDVVCISAKGRPIKPKTIGQKDYIKTIQACPVTIGAGRLDGQDLFAVAAAVKAFREKEVSRIILTRPAVEAGERLGFLPETCRARWTPTCAPVRRPCSICWGRRPIRSIWKRGTLRWRPLAYMRGRTLDDSFIILDEAQNTSREQMKMFLTRMGFGSRVVITGDVTQIDLPSDKPSGLKEAMRVLDGVEGVGICRLTQNDVVRHIMVQRIIEAYAKFEEEEKK